MAKGHGHRRRTRRRRGQEVMKKVKILKMDGFWFSASVRTFASGYWIPTGPQVRATLDKGPGIKNPGTNLKQIKPSIGPFFTF